MIKAVVFDMDGTLFDTERFYASSWLQAGKELNFAYAEESLAACTGRNTRDSGKFFEEHYAGIISYDEFIKVRTRYYEALVAEHGIPLKPGALECLTYLKDRGYGIALATATRTVRVLENLEKTDFLRFFDVLVTGDMVKNGKPDPESFLLAAEKLGVRPDECVAVEDSFNGVHAIAAAGMYCVMVPDVTPPTDEILTFTNAKLETLHELPALVEGLNG